MAAAGQFDPVALERVGRIGGPDLVRRLVATFLAHAPTRLAAARAGAGADDLEAVGRAAHALRGSAGNLGAIALMDAAARLETACRDARGAEVPALLAELESALAGAREHLQGVVEELA